MSAPLLSAVSSVICEKVSCHLQIPFKTTRYVLQQVAQGSTVPFLARYRRDETGNLDEKRIRMIIEEAAATRELERRRNFMLQSLTERQLLTTKIVEEFQSITDIDHLEDAWEAYKVRKTSLASRGREQGLPAEKLLFSTDFLPNLSFQLKKVMDAEKLMIAIIVEEIARNAIIRKEMLQYIEKTGRIHANLVKNARKDKAKALRKEQFDKLKQMFLYYDGHSWPMASIKSHAVLAIQRGEEKGVLQINVTCGPQIEDIFRRRCKEQFPCITERQKNHGSSVEYQILRKGLNSAYTYLINTSKKSARRDLKKRAEEDAIEVFSTNLRYLLLQRPLSKARILAMDPGLGNGVKCVVLDEDGNLVDTFKCSVLDEGPMKRQVQEMVEKHHLNKIVIGNGTASQRTAQVISQIIADAKWRNVEFAIVSETGASVYSASDAAKEELLDLDILYRGAVSIGRRVLDPLSELVKIPVKSMGIGMYQHDVNEKKLTKALGETVESCVASVGVNAAVANKYVMEKVPGISKSIVHQIILARHASRLRNREDLRHVPSMTEGMYTQIVGFFRFPNSSELLDNTVVLPEWYEFVRRLGILYRQRDEANGNQSLFQTPSTKGTTTAVERTITTAAEHESKSSQELLTSSNALRKLGELLSRETNESFHKIAVQIGCGLECLRLIERELLHPGLDPRSTLPHAGFMRTKLTDVKELQRGDVLKGVVQSVTTFGAFVDCGLEQNVLVKGLGMDQIYPGALITNLIFIGLDHLRRPQVERSCDTEFERFDSLAGSTSSQSDAKKLPLSFSATTTRLSSGHTSLHPFLTPSGAPPSFVQRLQTKKPTAHDDNTNTCSSVAFFSQSQQLTEGLARKRLKTETLPIKIPNEVSKEHNESEENTFEL